MLMIENVQDGVEYLYPFALRTKFLRHFNEKRVIFVCNSNSLFWECHKAEDAGFNARAFVMTVNGMASSVFAP